ncbi:MAG: glycerophosphodiester phosphodiesterase [Polyangiaceae bacterium]|nr:glycerophosphodiester phosphodiesterase [Polyangiaceae bacterium]MCW5788820.1 glycerophosphodiester phosphodiesterase [Polyangiaceae bacterium]
MMKRPFLQSYGAIGSLTDNHKRLCFAHRGGASLWPENTLEAFRGALALGVTHLESDLRQTRDGHLVLFHDARVERVTNGRGYVHEHTLAELQALDAGYRFYQDGGYPYRGRGVRIPTLEEVLDALPEARLNLELKGRSLAVGARLWQLIEHRQIHERLLVAAANDLSVQRFRELSRGQVATSAGSRECLRFVVSVYTGTWRFITPEYDALQLPLALGRLPVVTRRSIQIAHELGVQVHAWTVDDPETMRALWRREVDGIMTDRPDLLMSSL